MGTAHHFLWWAVPTLPAIAAVTLAAGCAEKENETRELDVSGTVESVDLASRVVQVSTYVEKAGAEQSFPVQVTDDTEILINGALARLEDVRVGERAKGTVRVVKQGNRRVYAAQQVRIERAEVIVAPDAGDTDAKETNGAESAGSGAAGKPSAVSTNG